jgi:hypothetical protein
MVFVTRLPVATCLYLRLWFWRKRPYAPATPALYLKCAAKSRKSPANPQTPFEVEITSRRGFSGWTPFSPQKHNHTALFLVAKADALLIL